MKVNGGMHGGCLLLGLLLLFLCVELNRARSPSAKQRSFKKSNKLSRLNGKRNWMTTKVPSNLPVQASTVADTSNGFQPAAVTGASRQWLELESVPPTRISAKLHDDVVLECMAVGSPPPTILWLKDGKAMDSASTSFDSEELMNGLEARIPYKANPGFTMAKLRSKLPLRCILPEDEGDYTCMAIQDGAESKQLQAVSTVVIEEDDPSEDWKPECEFRLPPFAYSSSIGKRGTPAYIHAAETVHMEQMGNDIVLPCRSGGKPKPKVVWTGNDGRLVVLGKKFQINTKGDLVIKNLNWNDMGEFNCSVQNPYGAETVSVFVYPLAEDS